MQTKTNSALRSSTGSSKKLKEFKRKILELEDEKEKLGKQIQDLEKKRKSLRDLENELRDPTRRR